MQQTACHVSSSLTSPALWSMQSLRCLLCIQTKAALLTAKVTCLSWDYRETQPASSLFLCFSSPIIGLGCFCVESRAKCNNFWVTSIICMSALVFFSPDWTNPSPKLTLSIVLCIWCEIRCNFSQSGSYDWKQNNI